MFRVEMKEKYEHYVKIQDFDGEAVKLLIEYIYTGQIDIDEDNVINLLQAADYLQLHDVKQFCFEFLESIISPDNSLEILRVVNLYKNDELKDHLQHYMSESFEDISQTSSFANLSKNELMDYISNLDRNFSTETSLYKAVMEWTKQDRETRGREFPHLFNLVNLSKVSGEFLKNVVLEEKLVIDNVHCYKLTLNAFHNLLKVKKVRKNKSVLLSLGGTMSSLKFQEVFNPYGESIATFPNSPANTHCQCLLKSNDVIYCIGGKYNCDEVSKKVWRMHLNEQNLKWSEVASMNQKRYVMGAAVYHDTLVVAGGADEKEDQLKSSEYYIAATNEWKLISPMSHERSFNALVSCNGKQYALGGWGDGKYLTSVECLSALNETWEESQPMLQPRKWFAAVNCDNAVYAIGGQCGDGASTRLKSVEKYSPDDNQWVRVSDMNVERRGHAACTMNGKIYVVGGLNAQWQAIKTIECYNPMLDSWSIVGETDDELFDHSIIAL